MTKTLKNINGSNHLPNPTKEEIAQVKKEVEAMKPESKSEAISYFAYVWNKHNMKKVTSKQIKKKVRSEAKLLTGLTKDQFRSRLRSIFSRLTGQKG